MERDNGSDQRDREIHGTTEPGVEASDHTIAVLESEVEPTDRQSQPIESEDNPRAGVVVEAAAPEPASQVVANHEVDAIQAEGHAANSQTFTREGELLALGIYTTGTGDSAHEHVELSKAEPEDTQTQHNEDPANSGSDSSSVEIVVNDGFENAAPATMGGTSSDRHESKTGETGNIDSKYESDVTKAGSGSGSTDIAVGDSAEMAVPAILNGTSSSQNESNGTEPADTEMKNNKDTANPASAMSPDHTVVDDTIEVAVQSAEYGDASNNDGAKKAEPEDITMEDAAQVTEHGEPAREDESSIAQSGATMDVEVHHPESDNADNESEEDEDQDDDTTMEDAFQAPDEELIITEHEKSDANDRDDGDNVTEHETTEAEAEDNHTDQEENDADGEDSDAGVEDEMMEKQMNIAEEREAQAGLPQYLAAARRTAAPTLQVAATSTRDDRPLTSTTPWEEERPAIEVPRWRTPSPIRPLSPALALEPIYEGDLREQFKFMWVRNIDILGKDGQLFESYLSGWYQKMKREGNLLLGKGVTKLKLEKKYAEAAAAFDAKFPSDFPDEVGEKDDGAQQRKKSTSDQIVLDGSARGFVVTARQMIDAGIFAGGGVTHNVASFVELVIGSDTRYSHEDIQLALRYLQEERYIKAGGYAGDGVFDNEMPLVFGNPKPHSG